MSGYQMWLHQQSKEFLAGFDAYCEGQPKNQSATKEWLRGWEEAQQHEDE